MRPVNGDAMQGVSIEDAHQSEKYRERAERFVQLYEAARQKIEPNYRLSGKHRKTLRGAAEGHVRALATRGIGIGEFLSFCMQNYPHPTPKVVTSETAVRSFQRKSSKKITHNYLADLQIMVTRVENAGLGPERVLEIDREKPALPRVAFSHRYGIPVPTRLKQQASLQWDLAGHAQREKITRAMPEITEVLDAVE